MPALRLAMAQINPTVGDLAGNSTQILEKVQQAQDLGSNLVLFPELALTGYPIEDLALSQDFLNDSGKALEALTKELAKRGQGHIRVVVGHPALAKSPTSWAIGQNCASLIFDGKVQASYAKHHLPNYSVFDEYRVFVPGDQLLTFEIDGLRFATVICEDIWQSGGPVSQIASHNVDLTLVLNGSPFERSKTDTRFELVSDLASKQSTAVAYVNLVGGQDDLVFDGNSFLIDAGGKEIARAKQFDTDLLVVEIESKNSIKPVTESTKTQTDLAQVWNALVLGVRDYVRKNGFKSVVLGLSGGIDSAVCASIAVDAIGAKNVFGVSLPSKYSSDHSLSDAALLAKNTGLVYSTEPIEPYVEQFVEKLKLQGLAAENLQARIRAVVLMAKSNTDGHLLLSTGNKTELAVGYSTIYGDAAGGYAPIKDVEKTLVWDLARYRNELATKQGITPPIPETSISKPPSAELRPDQLDQDSLPDYAVLDRILELHIEQRMSESEIIAQGLDATTVESVIRLVSISEWKRRQSAIGPRITKLAFGRERRLPITRWSK
ncbi:MAG: NAD+ synthase [Actinobacteria bacterium]|uniref:NAD(+) synthase (glutamine-hydrolyzing) n=1 Tax=freshwater metagenome TaxID=449393 RepID=A0A6J6D694_9ZZZZ|nr:NAD+ synthase [Actinomycetota bacterium]